MGVGKIIDEIRKQKNYTLDDLHKKSGISPPYLSGINNEKQDLPMRTFLKIAEALEVNPSYIMERSEIEYGFNISNEKYSLANLLKLLRDFDNWSEKDREELFIFATKIKELRDMRK